MPFWINLFKNCKCCVEQVEKQENTFHRKQDGDEKDVNIDTIEKMHELLHDTHSDTLTLKKLKELHTRSPIVVLKEFILPTIFALVEENVIRKSKIVLNHDCQFVELDDNFHMICCLSKEELLSAINALAWMKNIHHDDAVSVAVHWLEFEMKVKNKSVLRVFVKKFRIIDKINNVIRYCFAYALVETYAETEIFRCVNLFCFELEKKAYEKIHI